MTEQEAEEILIILYAEVGRDIPPMKIGVWAELLKPVPYLLGQMAAHRMIRLTKFFGEPQFSDYRAHVNFLHREAKRALRGRVTFCSAAVAHMTADEREAFEHRNKPPAITPEQAKRILDALSLEAKGMTRLMSRADIEAERSRQHGMLEDMRQAKQKTMEQKA